MCLIQHYEQKAAVVTMAHNFIRCLEFNHSYVLSTRIVAHMYVCLCASLSIQLVCLWCVRICVFPYLCVPVYVCASVHNDQCVWCFIWVYTYVCMWAYTYVCAFCVSQGATFSPWPDGALTTGQMASTLPLFFTIPSSFPPTISLSLSSSPAASQTPNHLNPSFPTSQHPSLPSHLAHNKSDWDGACAPCSNLSGLY